VRQEPEGLDLAWQREGERILMRVPRMRLHTAIVVTKGL